MIQQLFRQKKNILYLVTHRSDDNMLRFKSIITEAAKAGVDLIQLREKNATLVEYRKIAKEVKTITDSYNIPLIINDHPIIASEINAAGVHIGQQDLDIATTRNIIGKTAILGVSIENIEQAQNLPQHLVSYAAISPLFASQTKNDTANPIGIETAKKIRDIIKIPLFAIGGITLQNAKQAMSCGINGICVISAVFDSRNPFKAASQLKQIIN